MTEPMNPGPPRRKRGLGKIGCLAIVAALVFFSWGMEVFSTRLDERRFPWLYAKPGRSTLVGTWVGTMTTGGGVRRGVLLEIKIQPLNFRTGRRRRRSSGSNRLYRRELGEKLDGAAMLCGASQP